MAPLEAAYTAHTPGFAAFLAVVDFATSMVDGRTASEINASQAKPAMPAGTQNTVAVTVRLDPDRYKRLITYGARFAPRRKNQEIFVEALDACLATVE